IRTSSRRSLVYSGVSLRAAATTAWWRSPSTRSAPVRAMLSRSDPSDWRSHCSCARYCRKPLSRTAIDVRSRKLAPSRHASRRQIGRFVMDNLVSGGTFVVHRQLGDGPLEEQLDGPVERHAKARGERRQLQHVNDLPQQPRGKAGELEPAEIGNGAVAAQRHHLAEQPEVEGPARMPGELRDELLGERAPLAKRHLCRRRVQLVRVWITLGGVVAHGVHTGRSLDLEDLVDGQSAVARFVDGAIAADAIDAIAIRPGHALARNDAAARNREALGRYFHGPRSLDLNPTLYQLLLRVGRQIRGSLRKDRASHQHQANHVRG